MATWFVSNFTAAGEYVRENECPLHNQRNAKFGSNQVAIVFYRKSFSSLWNLVSLNETSTCTTTSYYPQVPTNRRSLQKSDVVKKPLNRIETFRSYFYQTYRLQRI